MTERRFLIALSLARLIEREQGPARRVVEGFFPREENRVHFVRVEGDTAKLVLMTRTGGGEWQTEAVDVPQSHAEALMEVSSGHVAYDRFVVPVAEDRSAILDRLVEPEPFDLLTAAFETREDAERFETPPWFGREVTADAELTTASIALGAKPFSDEEVSERALNALLDAFEGRYPKPARTEETQTQVAGLEGAGQLRRGNHDVRRPAAERAADAGRAMRTLSAALAPVGRATH